MKQKLGCGHPSYIDFYCIQPITRLVYHSNSPSNSNLLFQKNAKQSCMVLTTMLSRPVSSPLDFESQVVMKRCGIICLAMLLPTNHRLIVKTTKFRKFSQRTTLPCKQTHEATVSKSLFMFYTNISSEVPLTRWTNQPLFSIGLVELFEKFMLTE